MDSESERDHEVTCECVFVCICASKKGAPKIPEPDESCRSKVGSTNANENLRWSTSNSKFSTTTQRPNSQNHKTMSSPGASKVTVSDSDFDWESEYRMSILEALTEKEYDSNICGNCTQKKDENDPLMRFRNSSHFAVRLLEFCLRKPKCKQICTNDIKRELEKQKCKVLNADDVDMKCYDQVIEMYLKILTTKELNENNFLHINNILKILSKKVKGLVTEELIIDIKKTIKENGYEKDNHQTQDALKYFNSAGNKSYAKEYFELVNDMQSLQDENRYPDPIFAKFMEPIAKSDVIQSKLNLLSCLYCPAVITHLGILGKEGLLSKFYFGKHTELEKLTYGLIEERTMLCEKMKNSPEKILDGLKIKPNGLIYYDVEYRILPMEDENRDLVGQIACMSKHNTPFCEMCGLQNSWLKTFKKRGIHIKEADTHDDKHIWHNSTKDS